MAFKLNSVNQFGLLKLFWPLECFVSEVMERWMATFLSKSHFILSHFSDFHWYKMSGCSQRKFHIKFYAFVLANQIVISFFHLGIGVSIVDIPIVDVRNILKSVFAGSFLLKFLKYNIYNIFIGSKNQKST